MSELEDIVMWAKWDNREGFDDYYLPWNCGHDDYVIHLMNMFWPDSPRLKYIGSAIYG